MPKGAKVITYTWAMELKSSGSYSRRFHLRGFQRVDAQLYDGTSISPPVTKGFSQGSDGIFDDSLSNNKLNCVKNLLEISHTRGLEDL